MPATATAAPLSIASLKAFERHADTLPLRAAVIAARIAAKATRAEVDAYILPVFAGFVFADKRSGKAIASPEQLYLCDDEAECSRFYAACDAAHRAHGHMLPDGYCPALVAEEAVRVAERTFLAHVKVVLGVDFSAGQLDVRARALELMLHPPRK